MKQRLIQIIKELKDTVNDLEKERFFISDNVIFDKAVSIYLNESSKKPSNEKIQELATQKQLDFIHINNLDVNTENLTKKEAIQIIKEFKEQ